MGSPISHCDWDPGPPQAGHIDIMFSRLSMYISHRKLGHLACPRWQNMKFHSLATTSSGSDETSQLPARPSEPRSWQNIILVLSDIRYANLGQSTAQKPPPRGRGGRSGNPAGSPSERGPIAARFPRGGKQEETPKRGQPTNKRSEIPATTGALGSASWIYSSAIVVPNARAVSWVFV